MDDTLPGLERQILQLSFVALALLGLCVGSFLNVVIARVPEGLSVVHPRSRCPRCGHQLAWWENIPVLSWLLLRARCRGCALPISARYPLIELLTALLFLACLRRFGLGWELVRALVLVGLLVPLTFIDLEHWVLPRVLTYPGIAVGLALAPLGEGGMGQLRDAAIGAASGYLGFWALEWVGARVFKREALGGGDKDLLALIGAFLGWMPLLGIVFLSSLQGALAGIAMLLTTGRAGPALDDGERAAPPADPGAGAASAPPASLGAPAPSDAVGTSEGPPPALGASVSVTAGAPGPEAANPTDRPAPGGDEDDWTPEPHALPYGPWLALAALELLLLGPWLAGVLPEVLQPLAGGGGR